MFVIKAAALSLVVTFTGCVSADADRIAELEAKIEALEQELAKRPPAPVVVAPSDSADRPEWVSKGSNFDKAAGVGYAIGSVSNIKNHALARVTADNRARAELAKLLEVNVAQEVKTSSTGGKVQIDRLITTTAAMTLSGVQIVDHWFDPDGTVYALARLEMDVAEAVKKAKAKLEK